MGETSSQVSLNKGSAPDILDLIQFNLIIDGKTSQQLLCTGQNWYNISTKEPF